jgi:hypothetical protein
MGCLAGLIVFTQTDQQVYISDPDNRELVTLIESISVIRKTTDLIMIILAKQMKEKYFLKGLNDGIRIAVSESGYTNDVLSFEWLKLFDVQTQPPTCQSRASHNSLLPSRQFSASRVQTYSPGMALGAWICLVS